MHPIRRRIALGDERTIYVMNRFGATVAKYDI
jgi:hypothetical protein